MKITITFFALFFLSSMSFGQASVDGITSKSYRNARNTYNYTYWDTNWMTSGVNTRKFTNQTSSYNISINYSQLSIASLSINDLAKSPTSAFGESNAATFPNLQAGNIDYKVLQNGVSLFEKPSNSPTQAGIKISQMVDYGTWCNRRVIDNLRFTGNAAVNPSYTGIEFTNWHNRFRITFHVKPLVTISNAQLQLSVEMPEAYSKLLYSGGIFGFATSDSTQGFAVKGGITADSVFICGNRITVRTAKGNLTAKSYELSLIFYAVKENFCSTYVNAAEEKKDVTITASQNLPNMLAKATTSYADDEGVYYIDIPSYNMGYGDGSAIDLLQNIKLRLLNNYPVDKRVRLCFREKSPKNVVGFSSMLRNPNGDPTGLPLQISKNWHTGDDLMYAGSWVREYTEVIVPANTTLNFDYTRVGARWGKIFGAFSHQLSVVGAGVPRGGWLQAGLGGFGENITFSPDYEYGSSNICDYRPFLVTNQYYGGTSKQYNWTGNLGGMDLFRYEDTSGNKYYQSQVKTRFKKYGPNLSETSISTYSSDMKLKMDYTYFLNRADDFLRVYFKIKVKALKDAPFSRFDIFQMGSDTYRTFRAQSIAYGNSEGVIAEFLPATGKVGYTTEPIPLPGKDAWLWAGDGLRLKTDAAYGTMDVDANNSFIVRSYTASFGGVPNNTPYFRERVTSTSGFYPQSYCIVPPKEVTSFLAGDSIELILEVCLIPKLAEVYYGPNKNYRDALAIMGNTWKMLYREALGNSIQASSTSHELNLNYPLTVKTVNNTATVNIHGGVGYVPLVFSNLTSINDPKLWLVTDKGEVLIDQSKYGKDFWQAEHNNETGLYELIYNVNHDTANDTPGTFTYRLETAPSDDSGSELILPPAIPLNCIPSEPIPFNCSSSNPSSSGGFLLKPTEFESFPNPIRSQLTILSHQNAIRTIRLINMQGIDLIRKIKINGHSFEQTLDVSSIPAGIYLLMVNNECQKILVSGAK